MPQKIILKLEGKHVSFFEYEKEHEGYWTAEKFLVQLETAYAIADVKYA